MHEHGVAPCLTTRISAARASLPEASEQVHDVRCTRGLMWTQALLKETMLHGPMVCVSAVPSVTRAQELADLDQARLAQRCHDLGQEGLRKVQQTLDDAVASNESPVPDAVLQAFDVPSVDCISFIPIATAVYPAACKAERLAQLHDAWRQWSQLNVRGALCAVLAALMRCAEATQLGAAGGCR